MDNFDQNNFSTPPQNPTVNLEPAQKGNVVLGFVGALIGAALGGVLWLLVSQLGYIVGIVGFVMVFCAVKGFEILGKNKSTTTTNIIILLLCMVMIFFAEYFSCVITFHNEITKEIDFTFGESMKTTWSLIKETPDIKSAFIKDLIFGYVFTIAASITSIKNGFGKRR